MVKVYDSDRQSNIDESRHLHQRKVQPVDFTGITWNRREWPSARCASQPCFRTLATYDHDNRS
jgi:hypothetical protein